jgi:probable F420-dependent oxidoreductase
MPAPKKIRFAVAPHVGWLSATGLHAFADAVEADGFDGVWLSDLPTGPSLDPLLGLAQIAARTTRLRLGANVVPLGRNPFLLAKQLAQLDQLSEGRLLLSFVPGLGQATEREALGLGTAGRGELLEEMLILVRAWWTGEPVVHTTSRWSYSGVTSPIRPQQDPLEVWLGGRGPGALDRVGRLADGWLGAFVTPAEAALARERIQAAARVADRTFDPEHFGLSIGYAQSEPDPGILRALGARRPETDPRSVLPVGRDGLRSMLADYIDSGLSKFVLRPVGTVESWTQEAAWLAAAVLDLQT